MTFLEPWFLLATVVALVPVILHLMHRQRAPRQLFSTLRFLRASVQRTRRRKILQDALLLVARVAILFLLAFGLARPAVRGLHGLLPGRGGLAVAIVLDNSGSMAAHDATETRFERARAAVRQILGTLNPGDQAALLTTASVDLTELNQLLTDHELLYQALERCPVVPGTGQIQRAVRRAVQLLDSSRKPLRELYIVSDCQATDWQDIADWFDESSDVPVLVVDVYRSVPPNLTLEDVQFLSPGPLVRLPVLTTARVHNGGATEQTRRVELLLAGRRVASSEPLTVAPGQRATAELRFQPDRAGYRPIQVRLTGSDALPLDDTQYAVRLVHDQLRVALITEDDSPSDPASDAYYLAQVLQLDEPGRWPIRLDTLNWDELSTEPLGEYAAVFLVGLPPGEPDRVLGPLQRHVQQGGQLVWVPASGDEPDRWRQWSERAGQLLPGRVSELVAGVDRGVEGGWRVSWLDRNSVLFRPLRIDPAAYAELRVFRYLRWAPGEGATVAIRLENGDPLLLARPSGQGSVWSLATVPHLDWTTLPVDPLFVPLVTRLVFSAAESQIDRSLSVLCGQSFRYPLERIGPAERIVVQRPDGELVRPATVGDGQTMLEIAAVVPGIYTVRQMDTDRVLLRFAANADAAEFDLRHASPRGLRQQLEQVNGRYVPATEELAAEIARLRRGTELMEPMLWLVLALLAVEALMANRLARTLPPAPQRPSGPHVPRAMLAEMDRVLARR